MENTDRREINDAQKAKLIFLSLAALVLILLIWSVASASKARSERDAAQREMEMIKSDNIKLEQMLKDVHQENESLRKKVQQLEAKAKAKPARKKKTAAKKSTTKKTTKSSKGR